MRKFKIGVNGHWYEIEIKDLDERPMSVLVDGELYKVELAHEPPDTDPSTVSGATLRTRAGESVRREPEILVSEPELEARAPVAAEGQIVAPMPGKILTIHVTVGDRVQHQDVLCTLEAMKMENEIMAPAEGVVKEIRVTEGQDVLYGDVLFVIG